MIILTGGAGFIGSCLLKRLNDEGIHDILIVDQLGCQDKWKNLVGKYFDDYITKLDFLDQLSNGKFDGKNVSHVIHLGACSATTEANADYLYENNTRYTINLAQYCVERKIPFLYASSAATYGLGEQGYVDSESNLHHLKPINMYAFSKHNFDLYARKRQWFNSITGLKFFNVYGPNENHKKGMTSIVWNCYHQIIETGSMRLFKSDHPDYTDGGQLRDFIYIKDVVDIMLEIIRNPSITGLYNLGTGKAESWLNMSLFVFKAMGLKPNIEFVDMPPVLRGKYQYFTEAEMSKLLGKIPHRFMPHEKAVEDYVSEYLKKQELL